MAGILIFACVQGEPPLKGDPPCTQPEGGSPFGGGSPSGDVLIDSFPVPSGNPAQLFYVQRTPNINTIVYELNYKDGVFDEKDPVHVFWIRYGDKGQKAELSFVQERFAYGIRAKSLGRDKYDLWFVSYKKYHITLQKDPGGKYHAYVAINKKTVVLNRIFISIHGGSFWSPNIEYVEIRGTDTATGTEVVERMNV